MCARRSFPILLRKDIDIFLSDLRGEASASDINVS
jgi:hypothetical protein